MKQLQPLQLVKSSHINVNSESSARILLTRGSNEESSLSESPQGLWWVKTRPDRGTRGIAQRWSRVALVRAVSAASSSHGDAAELTESCFYRRGRSKGDDL